MTGYIREKDKNYDLVSVLYHALSGADSCRTYLEDAKKAGDVELADFFLGAMEQYEAVAQKAKDLCKPRL